MIAFSSHHTVFKVIYDQRDRTEKRAQTKFSSLRCVCVCVLETETKRGRVCVCVRDREKEKEEERERER